MDHSNKNYITFPAGGELIRPLLERFFCGLLCCMLTSACGQSLRPAESTEPVSDSQYDLLLDLDIEAVGFTVDKLQNIYYFTKKSEIVKLWPDGSEQFRYINKTLGLPTYIDATNPFNLLLFYSDYQTVVTLDRTMNLAAQFNLFDIGLFGVEAVGMASDGNLWVYDVVNFRLKKIAKDGKTLLQSGNLGLELDRSITPKSLIEREQIVYLNDPEFGIMVFDVFGKYLKTLPLKGIEQFQIVGEQLLFFRGGIMEAFHLNSLLQNPILLPDEIAKGDKIMVAKDRLFVLSPKKLRIYMF